MPVYLLGEEIVFPPPEHAEQGLLAVGGDLTPERLLVAYTRGIFPWYSERDPILWHSPDPRFVLTTDALRIPKRLRRRLHAIPYRLTMDSAFAQVIANCATAKRPSQQGTWITEEMASAYEELHRLGFAHSVEAWSDDVLVGGLYGVSLGGAFFGESMFAKKADASKIAFVMLVRQLEDWAIRLVDCQIATDHLARFGAQLWSRKRYLTELKPALEKPTRRGRWDWDGSANSLGASRAHGPDTPTHIKSAGRPGN